MTADVVFLLDVDNTLLDNDAIVADLRSHLECEFGAASAEHYWVHLETLRSELGYVDYLGALQRYRRDAEAEAPDAQRLLQAAGFLIEYPFASRVYPRAFDAVAHLGRFGPTVILSDGDVVFQPRKVRLLDAFKRAWGSRVTTVFPRQGHYAFDPAEIAKHPAAAELTVEHIGDLVDVELARLNPIQEKS